ncbi:MAG TPA: M67 family metallopeptidase [Nitrososphaeraceae archaeon]|nr:M67 family metallopeptidase [Nitrososphaeraceae archaeon]
MHIESISIHHSHLHALEKLAVNTLPNESCAILLGKRSNIKPIVQYILPMNNSSHSSIHFNIDPDDLYHAYDKARLMNLDIIAIFHSHPSPPIPSAMDKIFMLINPVIWIIYSTSSHTFKAFISNNDDQIQEINILLIKD